MIPIANWQSGFAHINGKRLAINNSHFGRRGIFAVAAETSEAGKDYGYECQDDLDESQNKKTTVSIKGLKDWHQIVIKTDCFLSVCKSNKFGANNIKKEYPNN